MRKYILSAVLLALFVPFLTGCAKPAEIGTIETFSFRQTAGAMMYASTYYGFARADDGSCTATIKPAGVPDEQAQVFTVDEDFARALESVLREHEVGRWNGFHKSNSRVSDGRSFSLSVQMQDGTTIEAGGYMKFPKNYAPAADAVAALFEALQQ